MRIEDVLKLDIKLLVAFFAIMEEGSVSKAADRLNVTQPALSKSLHRLRTIFNDPLFTRQAYGLSPTARALELSEQIRPILGAMSELLTPVHLNLKTLDRRFRLHVNESELESFIEPLLTEIYNEAPQLKFTVRSWSDASLSDMVNGSADLGVSLLSSTPSHIRSKLVGYMEGCLVLSDTHPLFSQNQVSLEELLEHRIVMLHVKNEASSLFATLQKVKQKGYILEPTMETESLMTAMQAVKRGMALVASRSIGDLFQRIATNAQPCKFIKVLPIPSEVVELDPYSNRHPIQLCWHERDNNDLAHRWLREKIALYMQNSPWIMKP